MLLKLCLLLLLIQQFVATPIQLSGGGEELENLFLPQQSETEDVVKSNDKLRQTYSLYPPYSFSPFGFYPWLKPGKIPFFYPPPFPVMPPDVTGVADTKKTVKRDDVTAPPDPALNPFAGTGKFFKDKKTEFLTTLFQQLAATSSTESPVKRAATTAPTDPAAAPLLPIVDPSFFISKKYDFLSKLFTKLNSTTPAPTLSEDDVDSTTTVKPTIVPPDFWVPFPFMVKPSKPPKPPKPSKPPKTILSKLTLSDLLENPALLDLVKRAVPVPGGKSKGTVVIPLDYYIPPKIDPAVTTDKFAAFLDKFFKKLNKTVDADSPGAILPKATVIPSEFWKPTPPAPTSYSSAVDAFLDLLFKSLDKTAKKVKREITEEEESLAQRRSFFDDLFNYKPSTTPQPDVQQDAAPPKLTARCKMMQGGTSDDASAKERSLAFKYPFGVMPPYVYAAKMAMYQDAMNAAAALAAASEDDDDLSKRATLGAKEDVLSEITTFLKCLDGVYDQVSALENTIRDSVSKRSVPADADLVTAQSLILEDLGLLKNDLVAAYNEALLTQKTTTTVAPASKKAKPGPFWAKFKGASTTPDPLAPIQKRIDLINSVFDMLTEVEKELVNGSLNVTKPTSSIPSLTSFLESMAAAATSAPQAKTTLVPPSFWAPDPGASAPPDSSYYLAKTQEYLSKLYDTKYSPAE